MEPAGSGRLRRLCWVGPSLWTHALSAGRRKSESERMARHTVSVRVATGGLVFLMNMSGSIPAVQFADRM